MMDTIIEAGATHWQIQLTVAMGNAVDNPELLLQPYRLVELMPMLARLYVEGMGRGMTILPGNNIGYFGRYEHLWRGQGRDKAHWGGCAAGQGVIGIEANGALKGCPSLATTNYTAGNVRTSSAEDSGVRPRRCNSAGCVRSTRCGAIAGPAITPTYAWPAAPGHRSCCSASAATILTAITVSLISPATGCGNGSSRSAKRCLRASPAVSSPWSWRRYPASPMRRPCRSVTRPASMSSVKRVAPTGAPGAAA